MKKLFLIILSFFILSSCLIVKSSDDLKPKIKVSDEPIIEIKNIERGVIKKKEIIEEVTLVENNTGVVDEEIPEELVKKEILSIEEQYCLSKGGKIVEYGERKACFTTDSLGLIKCDIDIFYRDRCRDKTVTLKDGIVAGFKTVTKVIEEKVEITEPVSLKIDLGKKIVEEIKQEEEVIIIEEKVEINTITSTMLKEQQGRSGKYFILVGSDGSTDLRMITNEGKTVSLYKGNINDGKNRVVIYDYELMINKQIKVFYKGYLDMKQEIIVNLNNI